ncbi:MAG TPA: arsenic resistance N-acetyltransferase ArsN2 [Longimicrobiales bacterium]|nr:arsenic resistance N-acetyltransferase ArsN2 [Longimicrobiales bacterium]
MDTTHWTAPVPATPARRDAILELLQRSDLPLEGVAEHLHDFLAVEDAGRVVGVVGVERYGDDALLRSLAVDPSCRAAGLGTRLTEALIARSRRAGVRRLYLLTTTAEEFFAHRGFVRITRTDVPPSVRGSVEFREACPESATVMVRALE